MTLNSRVQNRARRAVAAVPPTLALNRCWWADKSSYQFRLPDELLYVDPGVGSNSGLLFSL